MRRDDKKEFRYRGYKGPKAKARSAIAQKGAKTKALRKRGAEDFTTRP